MFLWCRDDGFGNNYGVEDLEELEDNDLDGNNEETNNIWDVNPKKYEPRFGLSFDVWLL